MRSVVLALCVVKAAAFGGTQYLSGAGGASEYAAGPHSQATQPGQNYNVGFQTQKWHNSPPAGEGQGVRGYAIAAWLLVLAVSAEAHHKSIERAYFTPSSWLDNHRAPSWLCACPSILHIAAAAIATLATARLSALHSCELLFALLAVPTTTMRTATLLATTRPTT